MAYIYSILEKTTNATLAPMRVMKDKIYDAVLGKYNQRELNTMERLYPKNIVDEYTVCFGDPHEVYPRLFLGSAYNAASYETLVKYNIKYIINVTVEISNYYPLLFTYHQISIRDNNTDSIQHHFNDSYEVINNFLEANNGNVLVHCYMGASRSATIVANYISKKTKRDIGIILNELKQQRPIVNPTIKFVSELNKFSTD
jgi:hypothetical protein